MIKRFMPLLAVLVLAGCAATQRTSFPPPEGPASSEPPRPEQPRTPPREAEPGTVDQPPLRALPPRNAQQASSPAVLSLMGRADTLARNGNMEMAAATLERALDLEPRNPFVYQRLAGVKLAQSQIDQAEAMARKSNSVAGDNPFVRSANWRLIAEARSTAGDDRGARDAMARAGDYRDAAQSLMR